MVCSSCQRLVTSRTIGGTTSEVIVADPEYDVGGVVLHPDTREVQLVAVTRARHEWEVLDRELADDVAALRALNPGDFSIQSRTHSDDRWIVEYVEDRKPVAYYLYDRTSRTGRFLFTTRPAPRTAR